MESFFKHCLGSTRGFHIYNYIYMYIYAYIYVYIYDTCAWTPNKDSRTYQLGSLGNRYPNFGVPVTDSGLQLPKAISEAIEATSDNRKCW